MLGITVNSRGVIYNDAFTRQLGLEANCYSFYIKVCSLTYASVHIYNVIYTE